MEPSRDKVEQPLKEISAKNNPNGIATHSPVKNENNANGVAADIACD